MSNDSRKINDLFAELDTLLKEMDAPEISLEDSFAKFKQGISLIEAANKTIEDIDNQLEILEDN